MSSCMGNRKGMLFFSITFGIVAHIGGLFWIHNSSLSLPQSSFNNVVSAHQNNLEWEERQKRGELLAELFGTFEAPILEVKESLQELKAEYAPNLELRFPTDFPLQIAESTFDFDNFEKSLQEIHGGESGDQGYEQRENSSTLLTPMPPLSLIGTPPLAPISYESATFDDQGVVASSEYFDIEVEYAPKRLRPGYVFKVTLLPHADIEFKKMRQNFYFLLDRSNSIPRTRYLLNKKAVAQALAFLKPGDRFNVLIFDHRLVGFQQHLVDWSEETVQAAREFLDKQSHGGYFAATELYASLGKIIPKDVAENEINNAILLSDGDTYLSQEKQRLTIGGWTAQNKGKVSLYTVTSGRGNNLPLLELLSSFNKGCLIYAQQHSDVEERLNLLMRTLQRPIGKHMVVTAVTQDPSMTILLQPKKSRIPDLYQNRPFVIYGTTNKLSDFVLFMQGKYHDSHFDIKKRISFERAKPGAYFVERGWTQLVAQEFYERYFAEGNVLHLEGAKQLLSPLNLPMPLIAP